MPAKVTLDIWSDVMCPWCAIGYGQLSQALVVLDGEIEADIRWRAFELNPDMPPEGEERAAHIARKYRRSAAETDAVRGHMQEAAHAAGVSLEYTSEGRDAEEAPPAMMWNKFDAHKLLDWTLERYGPARQTKLKLALFEAHFQHRRQIGERDELLSMAEESGIDRSDAAAALDDQAIAARVRAEQRQARDYNITGVPAVLVDEKFMIPGAQGAETYANALRRWVSRRGLANSPG